MIKAVIHFLRGTSVKAVPVSVPSTLRFFAALSLALAVVLPSAHSQVLGAIQALGQAYAPAKPAADTNARLTIYRPKGDAGPAAVSVFVNARYHASLLPGGFTEFCVKLAPIEIGVRAVEAAGGKRGPLSVSKLTPLAGSQQFFSFTAQALNTTVPSAREVTLQAKTRQEAELELPQTREQIHTLSRNPAVVACEDAPPIQAAVVVSPIPSSDAVFPSPAPSAPQIITLSADVLFQFDKAALSNISTPGRNPIDAVIDRVKSEYERIESINVVGHSDPFGKPELKQIRATERAAAVRDYFLANGLQSIRVVSEGRSDKELVVTSCDTVQTKASILCNAPNRRVVIEITGPRKKSP